MDEDILDIQTTLMAHELMMGTILILAAKSANPDNPMRSVNNVLEVAENAMPIGYKSFAHLSDDENARIREMVISAMRGIVKKIVL